MSEKLRERLVAVGAAVGYPFFYVLCLILFATWTFPFDKLRDRLVAGLNEGHRAGTSPWELAVADVSSSWVTGVKFSGIRLVDHEAAHEAGKSDATSELKIDSVVARIEVLPLLIGNHNLDFHAVAFGGKIDVALRDNAKGESFEITMDSLDLGQLTPVTDALQAPIEGLLGGTMKLELPDDKIAKANGTIAIEATDVAVGDGKAKLVGQLAVPRISLGTFSAIGEVKDGTLKLSKLGASGKDVDFLADARITLREQTSDSFADINLRARVSDAYRGKNDSTKALFGAPGSTIPGIIDMDPKSKQAKRADGFYAFHARGTLAKLDFSPGGTGGPTTGPGGSGGAAAAPAPGRGKGAP